MQKITILSPLHIGNGNTYPNYLINKNKKYKFEDLVRISMTKNFDALLNPNFLNKLINTNSNNSGAAKEEIVKQLNLNDNDYLSLSEEYEINKLCPRINRKDINEQIKNLNTAIIPGSSLKGYIFNVILFDIIKNNQEVQRFYKNNLNDGKKIRKIESEIFYFTNQKLMVRDILFDNQVDIKLISRIKKNKQEGSLFECIKVNSIQIGDYVNVLDIKREPPNYSENIVKIYTKEVEERISHLLSMFQEMNKNYMLNAINYEMDFINKLKNENVVDKKSILNQLTSYIDRLNKDHIICQLGRNTNYIVKSIGHAFDKQFYLDNFMRYFNPGMNPKNTKSPIAKPYKILSMNIVSDSYYEIYNEIPGFIELEW